MLNSVIKVLIKQLTQDIFLLKVVYSLLNQKSKLIF